MPGGGGGGAEEAGGGGTMTVAATVAVVVTVLPIARLLKSLKVLLPDVGGLIANTIPCWQ
jgi:hypothetical protein